MRPAVATPRERISFAIAKRPRWTTWLLYVCLAALSVKNLQEIGGVRLVSSLAPLCFFFLFKYKPSELKLPRPVTLYALFTCICLPMLSIVGARSASFYIAYLIWVVICAIVLILAAVRKLGMSCTELAQAYANAMVVMCVLSVFTLQEAWFGGYTLATFSDFPPLFGLQVSLAAPFLVGRYRNLKRIIVLTTLFFTFSRTSFVFALLIMLFQLSRESRANFIRGVVVGSLLLSVAALTSTVGSLMFEKMSNVVAVLTNSPTDAPEVNPSDLGRLAYASVTLDAMAEPGALAVGHGIKTNRLIILEHLNVSEWGLDESMGDATVHNVYLEMMSDVGPLGALVFIAFLVYAGTNIVRRFGLTSPMGLAFFDFTLSYLFEANYVTFFFQFFVCFFLWAATSGRPPKVRRAAMPHATPARTDA